MRRIREARDRRSAVDAFTQEYALSSEEGVVLMCLAESLLRVPDAATADRLIRDKIGSGDWGSHLNRSTSLFVNASTWALMLSGRVVSLDEAAKWDFAGIWKRLVTRSGEPVIRQAVTFAMRILGRQFVLGRTIGEALRNARPLDRTKAIASLSTCWARLPTRATTPRVTTKSYRRRARAPSPLTGRICNPPSSSVRASR